ncbi:hypothetical protein [uncultured Limosilactobacillus sp.]|uniref:hypothetical protein n=1 Tax=uncultured Limosilactobacillus sp. TaxID=2837629 RepID=UPI002600218A|nr:hypothetical protein [uncultured Limosilactobacillus sp.]
MKLHTTDLSDDLDDKFWNQLVENFLIIEKNSNRGNSDDGENSIDDKFKALESRINHISSAGIDQLALENAVEDVLRRKEVIS